MKKRRSARETRPGRNVRVVKLVSNKKGISNERVFGGSVQKQNLPEEIIIFRRENYVEYLVMWAGNHVGLLRRGGFRVLEMQ